MSKEGLVFLLEREAVEIVEKEGVLKNLPHREPVLFADRVSVIEPGKYYVGEKTFPADSAFYKGHFPDMPITPGVFLLEAMAQCFGAALMNTQDSAGKVPMFLSVEEAKFRTPVKPGDKIFFPIEALRIGKISRIYAEAYVNGILCASGKLNFILGDKQ